MTTIKSVQDAIGRLPDENSTVLTTAKRLRQDNMSPKAKIGQLEETINHLQEQHSIRGQDIEAQLQVHSQQIAAINLHHDIVSSLVDLSTLKYLADTWLSNKLHNLAKKVRNNLCEVG